MLTKEINKLREKLEKQIENNEDYQEIYNTSLEIDELITKYYVGKELSEKV